MQNPTTNEEVQTTDDLDETGEPLDVTIKTSVTQTVSNNLRNRIIELNENRPIDSEKVTLSEVLRDAIHYYFLCRPTIAIDLLVEKDKTIKRVTLERNASRESANEVNDRNTLRIKELQGAIGKLREQQTHFIREIVTRFNESLPDELPTNLEEMEKSALYKLDSINHDLSGFLTRLFELFSIPIENGVATFTLPDDTGNGKPLEMEVIGWFDEERYGTLFDDIRRKLRSHKDAADNNLNAAKMAESKIRQFVCAILSALGIEQKDDIKVDIHTIRDYQQKLSKDVNTIRTQRLEFLTELNNMTATVSGALDISQNKSDSKDRKSFGRLSDEFGEEIERLKKENANLKNRGFFARLFNKDA